MKTIKTLIAILTVAGLFVSCSKKSNEGYIINGHIEGVKDNTLVRLYDLDQQIDIDSAYTLEGDFILQGIVQNPTTCWIRCQDEYSIIQVENTRIKFDSPLEKMHLESKISGGKEQDLQNQINDLQYQYNVIYEQTLDSLMNGLYNEENKQSLIERYNNATATSQRIYIDFGVSHPNTYLGQDIIYMNRKSIPKDTLISIYERFTPEFKETTKGKALDIFLNEELAQKGSHFIDFNVKTLNGENFKLSSLEGKYIYLSFWSAGCAPCRLENRFLSRNFNKLPEDLVLVSFSTDINPALWKTASESDTIIWNNVSDLEGANGGIKTRYNVQAIPTSFLIDREGIIVEQYIGYNTDILSMLETSIEKMENEP